MYGLSGALLKQRIDEALAVIELGFWANIPVGGYSGGMMRRANLAVGLLHKPRVLFLDEPTVGVDPQSRNHIFESILRLNREEGVTIIYTTHYMEEAQTLCNRVGIIDHGMLDRPRHPAEPDQPEGYRRHPRHSRTGRLWPRRLTVDPRARRAV